MSCRVVITEQAERDAIRLRSKRQADRWYTGLAKAIATLSEDAG